MIKKIIPVLIILLVISIFVFWKKSSTPTNQVVSNNTKNSPSFLIEGFPRDKVPLYKLEKIESSKIFVNTDPNNLSVFGDTNFAYYNVVFSSSATQEEFLNYYQNLFEQQIIEEYENSTMVKGMIGQYKVSAAHYGSTNTGYLQVFLPNYNDESLSRYFDTFPKVFEANSYLIEHEKSYGLLNQNGGEIEFTKYSTVLNDQKDIDVFSLLENEYQEKYKNNPNYSYNPDTGIMEWNSDDFKITLAISRNHNRIYLVFRKKLL